VTHEFRRAVRENVNLLIGLAGGTGSGKTYSAFRLAAGIAGDKLFAVIDTENRRALHYADEFKFDHNEMRAPFSPEAYADSIKAADDKGYPVIVVDSMSHEHAGEGGLLDMHDAEFARMGGRQEANVAAWIKPKGEHKKLVNRLLQVRAHLILCFRAEEKIEMVRGQDGKMQVIPKRSRTGKDGWIPVCEKNLPYELTASFLLIGDKPGYPNPIKLEAQHRQLFPLDKPINEESGKAIAAWAHGATTKTVVTEKVDLKVNPPNSGETISPKEADAYHDAINYRKDLLMRAEIAASAGYEELRSFWEGLTANDKDRLATEKNRLQNVAREADRATT
jgi:hypothetical protein